MPTASYFAAAASETRRIQVERSSPARSAASCNVRRWSFVTSIRMLSVFRWEAGLRRRAMAGE